jgi:hypothetical protein
MDVPQQPLSLLDGDATLQDLGVALLVELSFNNDEGLSVARELSSLSLVRREDLTDEVVEIRDPPIGQRVRLHYWILINLHDLRVRRC